MVEDKIRKNRQFFVGLSESEVEYIHVMCCPCCEFMTLSSGILDKHTVSHGRERISSFKIYTCSECLSKSTEKKLMEEHVKIYHRNTENLVELKEDIHMITREEDSVEEYKVCGVKHESLMKSKRSHFQIQRKLKKTKWRFRIKKRKNEEFRRLQTVRSLQNSILTSSDIKDNFEGNTKKEEFQMDEPIDMSLKTQQKLEAFNNKTTFENVQVPAALEYPSLYSNIKSHLLDMLTKTPLGANLSNPMFMRYISSQMNSMNATKYFPGDPYHQRTIATPNNQLNSSNGSLCQHNTHNNSHMKMSMSKFQGSNNSSCGTLHRSLHRNNFTPFQNHILLEWYDKHKNKPYPSTEDTKHLSNLCGLSYPQVKKWFANKRARSTFYQKNELVECEDELRCDMLRFPLRVTSQLNADIVHSMEAQFRLSMESKMPAISNEVPRIQRL